MTPSQRYKRNLRLDPMDPYHNETEPVSEEELAEADLNDAELRG